MDKPLKKVSGHYSEVKYGADVTRSSRLAKVRYNRAVRRAVKLALKTEDN